MIDARIRLNTVHVLRGVEPFWQAGQSSGLAQAADRRHAVCRPAGVFTGTVVWKAVLCADGWCESTQDGARHTRRLAWQGHLQSYAGD